MNFLRQRQRIGIARTIALQPKLFVTNRFHIGHICSGTGFKPLNELKENFGFTYIFISHDLAVVKYMSDQVLVMNQGRIERNCRCRCFVCQSQKNIYKDAD
jgi:peptide/nickel transport system ATP-binding protein